MKLVNAVCLGALLVAGNAQVSADGAALYATKACIACHGAGGNAPTADTTPKIAGQNRAYIVQQLKDFKSGARSNGGAVQMMGIMGAVSDDEIEAIATYLSAL